MDHDEREQARDVAMQQICAATISQFAPFAIAFAARDFTRAKTHLDAMTLNLKSLFNLIDRPAPGEEC